MYNKLTFISKFQDNIFRKQLGYNFVIEYVNTKQFSNANVLSRLISQYDKTNEDFVIAQISSSQEFEVDFNFITSTLAVSFKMTHEETQKEEFH